MKLELISSPQALTPLRDEWNMLLHRSASNLIFLTWEWQTIWWDAYQPGDLLVLVGRDESGALAGIAPWFVEADTHTIRCIGCVDVTDYLDVITDDDHRETFLSAVVAFLAEHPDACNTIDLCNIPTGSPTLDVLPRLLTAQGYAVQVKQQEVCPQIQLPADFETYLNGLDKKNRHEARRKLRRVEDAGGDEVRWYIVGGQHDLNEEVERFLSLMAASHPEKARFLEDPRHVRFFKTVTAHIAACGWLQLSFLTVGGNPVAAYINFDYNNHIQVYNSGLLPDTYAHLSPGIVLLLYNIQHAISQGRTVFDFLRGDEDYKYRMGGKDHPVMNIEAAREAIRQ